MKFNIFNNTFLSLFINDINYFIDEFTQDEKEKVLLSNDYIQRNLNKKESDSGCYYYTFENDNFIIEYSNDKTYKNFECYIYEKNGTSNIQFISERFKKIYKRQCIKINNYSIIVFSKVDLLEDNINSIYNNVNNSILQKNA